jgi:2-polyprenyl-3-methyl-5-hydroxy-6-metoxy-1,4-benzoquinol methylase
MKEHDIRPKRIFDEYLRLTEEDTRTYFADCARHDVCCPACGAIGTHAFTKSGFSYTECPECSTLFVNPRPERSAFEQYYTDSPSTKYWATTFFKETEAARREKIWKPKAELIREKLSKLPAVDEIVDVGGGYGTFAEEISRVSGCEVTVIEPSRHLAEVCRNKGFKVIEKFLENISESDLADKRRCFVSFELFEHLYDPASFLHCLSSLMRSGDTFIFSTLNGLGADIRVLWEHSQAVSPPHHLNFFNPHSVSKLLAKCGFEVVEVTTPGRLDVNIIENNLPNVTDRFWKSFITTASECAKQQMQDLLATNQFSSHMMVICRKGCEPAEK